MNFDNKEMNCILCNRAMYPDETGEPYLIFKEKNICFSCYISLIPEIYSMAGFGDGGIIHIAFKLSLTSKYNRKKRVQIKDYKEILNKLLHKYKFKCVNCGSKKQLTIDHIIPVSKGGGDNIENLQILCKSCNSKKGAKVED